MKTRNFLVEDDILNLDTSPNLSVHNNTSMLQARIGMLKDQLGAVLEQISLLKYRARDILVATYAQKIGFLEYRVLCWQIDVRALHRKIELVTACLNRGDDISADVITGLDAEIEAELEEWRAAIQEQEKELENSVKVLTNLGELDPEDQSQIKICYRKLCRLLHPDVVGAETELFNKYWQEVQSAYSACDIDLLQGLLSVVEGKSGNDQSFDVPSGCGLIEEADRLENLLSSQVDELARMQGEVPYSYDALLQDKDWVEEKQNSLRTSIGESRDEADRLEVILEFLVQTNVEGTH